MINYRSLFIIMVILAFSSCQKESAQDQNWKKVAPSDFIQTQGKLHPISEADIAGIWRFPGPDIPPMEIHFNSDHSMIFKDGCEFYNPATWKYDEVKAELILSIPKMSDREFKNLESGGIAKGGSVDRSKKLVFMRVEKGTNRIYFCGFAYDKQ